MKLRQVLRRRVVLGLALPAALLAALLVQATGAAGTPLGAAEDDYRGTLSITVQYWGPRCPLSVTGPNRLRLQKTRTYRMPVLFARNPPAAVGVVRERNPFNFVISADPRREGAMTLASATVTADPIVGQTLYEYWRFTLRGSSVSGRLVRSYRETGLAHNLFTTTRVLIPCRPELGDDLNRFQTVKEGARLTGTFTERRVQLTVTGQTFDRRNRFTAQITAGR